MICFRILNILYSTAALYLYALNPQTYLLYSFNSSRDCLNRYYISMV